MLPRGSWPPDVQWWQLTRRAAPDLPTGRLGGPGASCWSWIWGAIWPAGARLPLTQMGGREVCGLVGAPEDVHAQPGTVEHVATVAGGAVVVHAAGSLAVTADGNTLKVLDLSTPESPVTRGTLTVTDRIWDLVVDPGAPTVRGSYEVVSQGQTVSIALADGELLAGRGRDGHPRMLDDAALAAVTQWEYRPTLLNGVAVPIATTVTVNFQLR